MSRGGVHLGGLAEHVRARGGPVFPAVLGTPLSLTLSGNEITDAVRAAGLSGDGLSPEGSMGLWEATTNLVTNGGFETNTTGWTNEGTTTSSRVTSQYKFGAASCEVVTGGSASWHGVRGPAVTVSNGTMYTASAWLRPASGRIARLVVYNSAGASMGSASTPAGDGTTWYKVSVSYTADANTPHKAACLRNDVDGGAGVAHTFYVDGVQLEQQPLATPYVETDGGTATRPTAFSYIPGATADTVLDETQGWVAQRFRSGFSSTFAAKRLRFFHWLSGGNFLLIYWDTTLTWLASRQNGSGLSVTVTPSAFAIGDVHTIIYSWTATQQGLSVNGSAFTTGANTAIPTLSSIDAYITPATSGGQSDSDHFWFACGTGTLSDADAATIHANGNSDPSPGLFPSTADLTMIWKAIDGTARTY